MLQPAPLDLERLPTEFFPSPVLEEPASPNTAARHKNRAVVVAYDHSNYSDAMIAKSINLGLLKPSDDIRIVHIVNQSDYRTLFAPMMSSNAVGIHDEVLDSKLQGVGDSFIYEIVKVLNKKGFNRVTSEVLRGDPKQSIVDYCHLAKPVYLLTGTRGLGAVKRTVMGSVSNYLTHHCPCPVLIVKLDAGEIEARKELNEKKEANFNHVLATFVKA